MRKLQLAFLASSVLCLLTPSLASGQVIGNGSSFARDLITRWSDSFGAVVGTVSYEPNGSTAGVDAVSKQLSDFGVTDVPLTSVALNRLALKQVPLAASGVAIIVNLPDLASNNVTLKLNGNLLSAIYRGDIKDWDHPRIASANPGVSLPKVKIVPVWRADGSGQSFVLTSYIGRQDNEWRRGSVGVTSKMQSSLGMGVKGGRELLETVKKTKGAIGYDAFSGATSSGLQIVAMQNAAKQFVLPSAVSIAGALGEAVWSVGQGDANTADLDGSAGASTYPMAAIAYALIPLKPSATRKNATPFFAKAMKEGDAVAAKTGFVAIPEKIKKSLEVQLN
jgi:phosphate transport system substrate-binding protein